MKNIYLSLSILLILCFSCGDNTSENRDDNKRAIVADSIIGEDTYSISTERFCTQMPILDFADGILYAEYQRLHKLKNSEKGMIREIDFNEWKHDNKMNQWSFEKMDSVQTILKSVNKKSVLANYYKIESAIVHNSIWPQNDLTVKFLNGSNELQKKVMNYAKEWELWCAVRLIKIAKGKADITVTFNDKGLWSHIGKSSSNYVPSMSLTGLENENEDNFRGTVLHEFGHALGFVHEHQNPNFELQWNEPEVYKYYDENYGWSETETYENVIYRYNFGQYNHVDATKFDSNSIMIYEIPPYLLKNNRSTSFHNHNDLSVDDKRLAKLKYY